MENATDDRLLDVDNSQLPLYSISPHGDRIWAHLLFNPCFRLWRRLKKGDSKMKLSAQRFLQSLTAKDSTRSACITHPEADMFPDIFLWTRGTTLPSAPFPRPCSLPHRGMGSGGLHLQ
ncbi:unnamed protein product [Vitrella brassicaformis CCMP3155]|uniref:Uncharacterized protein n=1 Tax=Vitrella brassicaformis (strain CCMP3155) TaxID=1169540 RepID=A0A0G4G0M8_VITBC|nr:unnamed protein product [Vitrella brassicaformis CCMP3155]|mmetsp:Transcript_9530/g.27459  ORF Transcript_9530/g.27459 Transcript_9530/m.27459 type:complete len:119 (-) Transcript_9530:441-797(-)|eukprot:CEM21331.1 unnamed protein product [Vitrella brassicaformis CCMP3155]